jgi:hypothetical protein
VYSDEAFARRYTPFTRTVLRDLERSARGRRGTADALEESAQGRTRRVLEALPDEEARAVTEDLFVGPDRQPVPDWLADVGPISRGGGAIGTGLTGPIPEGYVSPAEAGEAEGGRLLVPDESKFPKLPAQAAAQRESLLRYLSQEDADLVRIHTAQQQQGGLGAARQAYRAAHLPMYAQSPFIDPNTGQPVIDPETGQPVMQTAGEPGNAAPSPIGVAPGYNVRQPLTREGVGRYGSADALAARAQPRSARFDDAGQILATDGRPLLEVGPGGELRVRTDADGNALQPATSSTTTRGPMYSDGDELYWAGHSPEQIGPIQARLARAGLIGPEDSVTWGWWDETTKDAYTMALGYANQRGTTWIDALDEMQQLQEAGIGDRMRQLRNQYEPDIEAYRAPDPAAVRNDVRTTIEDYLQGHEAPTEALQSLINDLQGWHREQYDAETQAVMAAFDQQLEGLVDPNMWIPEQYGGTPPPEPAMGGIPPEGPAEVDLGARLSEAVRTRLAPQRELLGQQETNVGSQQSVHASVQGLLARLRGGL